MSGRAAGYGQRFVEYVEEDHRPVVVIAQIEIPTDVENAADIAAVDGVDSLFVGPTNLPASLGIFAEWDVPELDDASHRVIDSGVPVGPLTVQAGDVDDRVEPDFDYLLAGKDMTTLIETGERIREQYVESTATHPTKRDCFARVERSWIVRTKRKDGKQAIDGEPW